jgi:hypothetical protein
MRLLLAIALVLAGAAPAAADVTPLAPADSGDGPVIAGDRVLWLQHTRDDRLRVMERAAGEVVAMPDPKDHLGAYFAASPELVAVRLGSGELWVAETGQPLRRLATDLGLAPFATPTLSIAVSGRDIVTTERESVESVATRVFHRTLAGERREIPMPDDFDIRTVDVAGDLLVAHADGQVVVLNWRTGERLRALPLPEPPYALAVAADGTVAYAGADLIGYAAPGAAGFGYFAAGPADQLSIAGGRVAYAEANARRERVAVVEPPQELGQDVFDLPEPRVLFRGPPTEFVRSLSFNGDRVGWSTDTCRLVADVAGPSASRVPAGPCLRSEAAWTLFSPPLDRGRLRIGFGCITSARARCVVELAVSLSGRRARGRRLAVPLGRERVFRLRVGPRLKRALRRGKPVFAFVRLVEGKRRGEWEPLIL